MCRALNAEFLQEWNPGKYLPKWDSTQLGTRTENGTKHPHVFPKQERTKGGSRQRLEVHVDDMVLHQLKDPTGKLSGGVAKPMADKSRKAVRKMRGATPDALVR